MEKLYKLFAESVTKWKTNFKSDEFLVARLRLTFYYSLTAVIILGGSSVILYNTILSNFAQSIEENIFINPDVARALIERARDILFNRFITIDFILIFFIVVLGFLLTYKTLEPIRLNMQKQKRFIADASHELRTPNAVIISGLEVSLNNKKLDFSSAKKVLENTLEEMREFSKLSNTLLDISKYEESKEINGKLLDINKLVKSIIEKIQNLATKKEITLEIKMLENQVFITGNETELNRLFYNILDNAIKYTPNQGRIVISDKIVSNKYLVVVSDTGIGIPKDIIGRIFDPFFRSDSARNTAGAGLGLTLAKKIVENHSGTISLKSHENMGTTVTISIPTSSY